MMPFIYPHCILLMLCLFSVLIGSKRDFGWSSTTQRSIKVYKYAEESPQREAAFCCVLGSGIYIWKHQFECLTTFCRDATRPSFLLHHSKSRETNLFIAHSRAPQVSANRWRKSEALAPKKLNEAENMSRIILASKSVKHTCLKRRAN